MSCPPPILQSTAPASQRGLSPWFWFGIVLAGAAGLHWLVPTAVTILPRCPLHLLTGWHCPGCGMTRAALALVQGEFGTALRLNPLFMLLLPGWCLVWLYCRWRGRSLPWSPAATWLLVAVVVGFGIARNLPFEPFTQLAP